MQRISFILIALLAISGCKTPGQIDDSGLNFDDTTKLACDLADAADIRITYKPAANRFDIGIGKYEDGISHPMFFSIEELESFFREQKHKNLIIIVFSKNTIPNPEIRSRVGTLTEFFFSAGYSRVIIEQAYGNGRGIMSDKTNPQHGR